MRRHKALKTVPEDRTYWAVLKLHTGEPTFSGCEHVVPGSEKTVETVWDGKELWLRNVAQIMPTIDHAVCVTHLSFTTSDGVRILKMTDHYVLAPNDTLNITFPILTARSLSDRVGP